MIVYDLFVHKKSVSNGKVCIIFIKNWKLKKNTKKHKKTIFSGFFRWVFCCFFGGIFIANPGTRPPCPRPRKTRPSVWWPFWRPASRRVSRGSTTRGWWRRAVSRRWWSGTCSWVSSPSSSHSRACSSTTGKLFTVEERESLRHLWGLRKRIWFFFSGRKIDDSAPMEPDPCWEWYWTKLTNKPDF